MKNGKLPEKRNGRNRRKVKIDWKHPGTALADPGRFVRLSWGGECGREGAKGGPFWVKTNKAAGGWAVSFQLLAA